MNVLFILFHQCAFIIIKAQFIVILLCQETLFDLVTCIRFWQTNGHVTIAFLRYYGRIRYNASIDLNQFGRNAAHHFVFATVIGGDNGQS